MSTKLEELTIHANTISSRRGTITREVGELRFKLHLMEQEAETARTLNDPDRVDMAQDQAKKLLEEIERLESNRIGLDEKGIQLAQAALAELQEQNRLDVEDYSRLMEEFEIIQRVYAEGLSKLGEAHRRTQAARSTYERYIQPYLPSGTPAPHFPAIILPSPQNLAFPPDLVSKALKGRGVKTGLEDMRQKHQEVRAEAERASISEGQRHKAYLAEQESIKQSLEAKES